jgi:predicted P-loop ATPase
LLVYRPEEPFRKIETPELFLPDGQKLQVEVLAEGQQFVGDGIHPITKEPYRWLDESPETVHVSTLPIVCEKTVRNVIKDIEQLLLDAGAKPKRKSNGAAGNETPPGTGFFRNVNNEALANIGSWARSIFPRAKFEPGTGAWRVTSKDLGRDLEEDISIAPSGVRDFGEEIRLTPIDLVMRYVPAGGPTDAALWLCDRLGIGPETLGYTKPPPPDPEPEHKRKTKQKPENERPETDVSIELVMQLLPAKLRKQITEPGSGDRSKALFAVIKQLGDRGLNAIAIEHIIRAYPNGIGAKYVGRPDLDKEIERVLGKPDQPRETWKDQLLKNEEGKIRANLANAITAIRLAPEWQSVLGFNEFTQKIVLLGKTPWLSGPPNQPLEWASVDDIRMADWLQHNGVFVSTRTAGEAVYVAAHDHQFHPVRDYLQSLKWDGRPRLDAWCVAYLGAEDTPYVRAVGSRFLISGAARILQPGCKADCALILEGFQSTLKSTAVFTLSQPWFTDEISELGTKDSAVQLAGVWFVEWSELDSMTRSDIEKVKAYMSRRTDRFRPPYQAHVIEQPRQCVFVGTSNKTEYLRDETGGRRFWPIACGKIDIEVLRRDRDQLWAEALHRYNAGANWWLDTIELNADAEEEQAARRTRDPWEAVIEDWLSDRSDTSVQEILIQALSLKIERLDQAAANRVARCMRALNWSRYRVGTGTERGKWHYRRELP